MKRDFHDEENCPSGHGRIACLPLAACQTQTDPLTGRPQANNTAAGAGLGAVAGAITGLLIAKDKSGGDQRRAALIGAGVGALVGGSVGNYMDRQEAELRQQLQSSGVSVSRQGNNIILNMPGNVTFATDQDQLNPAFFPVLDSVAIVLNKYPRTLLDIDGHTDNTGSPNTIRRCPSAVPFPSASISIRAASTHAACSSSAMARHGRSPPTNGGRPGAEPARRDTITPLS